MSEKIKQKLAELVARPMDKDFIFDLLRVYDIPELTVKSFRRRNKDKNGPLTLRRKILFLRMAKCNAEQIEELLTSQEYKRAKPRFVIVVDDTIICALDVKTGGTLNTSIETLPDRFDFFNPLAGIEEVEFKKETKADRDASAKIAEIYDGIVENNNIETDEDRHKLNTFLSRLLFCFFAEDTGIFEKDAFRNHIKDSESKKQQLGKSFSKHLNLFFRVLNMTNEQRSAMLPELNENLRLLPYVNGGLFQEENEYREFDISYVVRGLIKNCSNLDWTEINPDILGSMFQAVVSADQRGSLGQHYTSVPNIMKVIEPLFLTMLEDELFNNNDNLGELRKLLNRLTRLRIFDPACGSGNFLIIAYKEIRRLEIDILKRLQELGDNAQMGSQIHLSQFRGIELDDFAREIAELSMWLAEHQMNLEFKSILGETRTSLPLDDGGYIKCENALRMDWEAVCPKEDGTELYILGNPPYLGRAAHSEEQKIDKKLVFKGFNNFGLLDLVACWFEKASKYIVNSNAQFAFVSTNSICQGEQVSMLWTRILGRQQSINFAHQSFKWTNNAVKSAAVAVVVVGVSNNRNIKEKFLFVNNKRVKVENISPYLEEEPTVIFQKMRKHITNVFPDIIQGNMANDGGALILTADLYKREMLKEPKLKKFVKEFSGADEFSKSMKRYCLWITDDNKDEALKIPFIREQVQKCKEHRLNSHSPGTQKLADVPWKFNRIRLGDVHTFLIPTLTSKRKEYIPIGLFDKDVIINASAHIIYDAELFIFGILSSRIHTLWVDKTSSEMKDSDRRYSTSLSYYTFPVPVLTHEQESSIEKRAQKVLSEREKHYEKTIAWMYDPDSMPKGLLKAHQELDAVVEDCLRPGKPFKSDKERVTFLLNEYEKANKNIFNRN